MQTALLLIALGFGFKIFAEASANAKKSVKQLGRLVGIVIMVVSFVGTLCTVWYTISCGKMYGPMGGKYWMGGHGMKKWCPITGSSSGSDIAADVKNK